MLQQINGFDDYYVDDTGVVYSNKSGYLKPISQWKDGKGRYLLVHIVNNDGKAKNVLVHRIVCEAFLPNPKDLPEVNHRRTGNRCQTCLPVGLKVIERVRGTQKHRPRLVQASVSSLHYKDNNPQNNNLSNLEWCTRKENLQQSYKTMSPVRNYRWTGTQQSTFKLSA